MFGRILLPLMLVVPCSGAFAQQGGTQQATPTLHDMMSTAMDATPPTAQHDLLRQLAGEWTYVVEMTMPGMPVMHGSGTTSIREILGGRFVEFRSNSDSEHAIASVMIMGYDSRKGKEHYFALGLDTMGHYYIDPKGTWNANTASLVLHGTEYDESTGKDMPYRQVYRFPGKDTMTCDVFMTTPDAKDDIRIVGIVYQRQQGRQVAAPPSHPMSTNANSGSTSTAGSNLGNMNNMSKGEMPKFSGSDIEAMDRAELQSALVKIMRARTMKGIEEASRANLEGQYRDALGRLRSMGSGQSSSGSGDAGGNLPTFAGTAINGMSMSEARSALTEIVAARRIPGLDAEQRTELSGIFQMLLDRIRTLSSPEVAKADVEQAEKEAEANSAGGSEDPPLSEDSESSEGSN